MSLPFHAFVAAAVGGWFRAFRGSGTGNFGYSGYGIAFDGGADLNILLEWLIFLYYKCGFTDSPGMKHDEKMCSQCGQRDRCKGIYEQLGKSEGPNVTWAVLAAFVVPILVFIASLAGIEPLLEDRFSEKTASVVAFLAAAVLTLAVIVVLWVLRRISRKS